MSFSPKTASSGVPPLSYCAPALGNRTKPNTKGLPLGRPFVMHPARIAPWVRCPDSHTFFAFFIEPAGCGSTIRPPRHWADTRRSEGSGPCVLDRLEDTNGNQNTEHQNNNKIDIMIDGNLQETLEL